MTMTHPHALQELSLDEERRRINYIELQRLLYVMEQDKYMKKNKDNKGRHQQSNIPISWYQARADQCRQLWHSLQQDPPRAISSRTLDSLQERVEVECQRSDQFTARYSNDYVDDQHQIQHNPMVASTVAAEESIRQIILGTSQQPTQQESTTKSIQRRRKQKGISSSSQNDKAEEEAFCEELDDDADENENENDDDSPAATAQQQQQQQFNNQTCFTAEAASPATAPAPALLSPEELQAQQREQMEEAIRQMAQQMKLETARIHQTLQKQNQSLLDELEQVTEDNVQAVTNVTQDVTQHVQETAQKSWATWTLLLVMLGVFLFMLITIFMAPKRREVPCVFFCAASSSFLPPQTPDCTVLRDGTRTCRKPPRQRQRQQQDSPAAAPAEPPYGRPKPEHSRLDPIRENPRKRQQQQEERPADYSAFDNGGSACPGNEDGTMDCRPPFQQPWKHTTTKTSHSENDDDDNDERKEQVLSCQVDINGECVVENANEMIARQSKWAKTKMDRLLDEQYPGDTNQDDPHFHQVLEKKDERSEEEDNEDDDDDESNEEEDDEDNEMDNDDEKDKTAPGQGGTIKEKISKEQELLDRELEQLLARVQRPPSPQQQQQDDDIGGIPSEQRRLDRELDELLARTSRQQHHSAYAVHDDEDDKLTEQQLLDRALDDLLAKAQQQQKQLKDNEDKTNDRFAKQERMAPAQPQQQQQKLQNLKSTDGIAGRVTEQQAEQNRELDKVLGGKHQKQEQQQHEEPIDGPDSGSTEKDKFDRESDEMFARMLREKGQQQQADPLGDPFKVSGEQGDMPTRSELSTEQESNQATDAGDSNRQKELSEQQHLDRELDELLARAKPREEKEHNGYPVLAAEETKQSLDATALSHSVLQDSVLDDDPFSAENKAKATASADAKPGDSFTAGKVAKPQGFDNDAVPIYQGRTFAPKDVRRVAAMGDAELLKEYLAVRPDFAQRDDANGWTAWHLAARKGCTGCIEVLVEMTGGKEGGSQPTKDGRTARDVAMAYVGQDHPVVRLLRNT